MASFTLANSSPTGAPEEAGISVVVADDNDAVRDALAELLGDEEYIRVVGLAANGAEAIDEARRTRPDIVIMDINMPGMGGIEATRKITGEMPAISVVGLSMREDKEAADLMIEAGAVRLLQKFGPPEQLLQVVRGFAP